MGMYINNIVMKDWTQILAPIIQEYGGEKIELNYETPFQLLCAVILSAQTTDKQVNRITPPFFAKVRESHDVIDMSLEEIESDLRYVNFFRNKSRFIKETGTLLATSYDGILPNDLSLIQTFPGIGVKTAKVVLSVLYDMPYVGVDTHIHRVMNRIGIVDTRTPVETDKKIDIIFDTETKKIIHHPLVLFGRYHCTARKPKCESCKIRSDCQYFRAHELDS
jgi:endonuclease III